LELLRVAIDLVFALVALGKKDCGKFLGYNKTIVPKQLQLQQVDTLDLCLSIESLVTSCRGEDCLRDTLCTSPTNGRPK
jgi:hypothetical protein